MENRGETRSAVTRYREPACLYPDAELADDALARVVRLGSVAESEAALRTLRERHPTSKALKRD